MTPEEKKVISITTKVAAPVEKVWNIWTDPKHIVIWNRASDDWHTVSADNDLKAGGRFLSRMEAINGSDGFDFSGVYNKIELHKNISYTLDDDRKVHITFELSGKSTKVTISFEAENVNPVEIQRAGWQAILDNFKTYSENAGRLELMHFEINIKCSAAKVHKTITGEKTYSEWTAEFNPSSNFEGSWEKGSKILFLGTDKDGSTGGMISKVIENIPGEFLSLEHTGIIQKGREITCGPEVDKWAGALENYTLTENKGTTLLAVDVDSSPDFKSYFIEMWPKALNKLKSICEK